jgi:hypothetical protein
MQVIKNLQTSLGEDITSMAASWATKAYQFGSNLHLGIHLFWDAPVTGTMFLEYSCDPVDADGVQNWVIKNQVSITTDQALMLLDANVPVISFRVRFERLTGSANVKSYVILKTGGN